MSDYELVIDRPKQDSDEPNITYILTEKLGSGNYGTVYKAYKLINNQRTNDIYAVKVITNEDEASFLDRYNEIEILKNKSHKNIINHVERFKTNHQDYSHPLCVIVMEYFEGKPARELLNKETDTLLVFKWLIDVLDALKNLHEPTENNKRVAHRDIKDDNILHKIIRNENENPTLVVKIVDFGIAKAIDSLAGDFQTLVGCKEYWAPERFKGESYTSKVDIWALAVTIYRSFFPIELLIDGMEKYIQKNPFFLSEIPYMSLRVLLSYMFRSDPSQRYDAGQLLNDQILLGWRHLLAELNGQPQFTESHFFLPFIDIIHKNTSKHLVTFSVNEIFKAYQKPPLRHFLISRGFMEKLILFLESSTIYEDAASGKCLEKINVILNRSTDSSRSPEIYKSNVRNHSYVILVIEEILNLDNYYLHALMTRIINCGGLKIILDNLCNLPELYLGIISRLLKHPQTQTLLCEKYSLVNLMLTIFTNNPNAKGLEDVLLMLPLNEDSTRRLYYFLHKKYTSEAPIRDFFIRLVNKSNKFFPGTELSQILQSADPTTFLAYRTKLTTPVDDCIIFAISHGMCTSALFKFPVKQYFYVHTQGKKDNSSPAVGKMFCLSCASRVLNQEPKYAQDNANPPIFYLCSSRCQFSEVAPVPEPSRAPLFPLIYRNYCTLPSPTESSRFTGSSTFSYNLRCNANRVWNGVGDKVFFVQDQGISPDYFRGNPQYFEVRILSFPKNQKNHSGTSAFTTNRRAWSIAQMAVGFSKAEDALKKCFSPELFCYNSDGIVANSSGNSLALIPFGYGDTVGCGIYRAHFYFTLNGFLLPFSGMIPFNENSPAATYYPTFSCFSNFKIQFRYADFKYQPLPCVYPRFRFACTDEGRALMDRAITEKMKILVKQVDGSVAGYFYFTDLFTYRGSFSCDNDPAGISSKETTLPLSLNVPGSLVAYPCHCTFFNVAH